MTDVLSDNVSGGFYTPNHADTKADGSKVVTASILGPLTSKYDQIAGICGEIETLMFVTSAEWARFAEEVKHLTRHINPDNFQRMRIRNLTVVNSRSDDQGACDLLNVPEARKCDFQNRRQRLISGRV